MSISSALQSAAETASPQNVLQTQSASGGERVCSFCAGRVITHRNHVPASRGLRAICSSRAVRRTARAAAAAPSSFARCRKGRRYSPSLTKIRIWWPRPSCRDTAQARACSTSRRVPGARRIWVSISAGKRGVWSGAYGVLNNSCSVRRGA